MIDIVSIAEGDIGVQDTQVKRAENIVATQLGKLSFAPDFGVDLRYFLQPEYQFQNEAFRSYILQRLAEQSVDVSNVVTTISNLFETNYFSIANTEASEGLVR